MDRQGREENLETKIIDTWATLDYRAEKWGPERVVFDAICNHFPEDCIGSWYIVAFVQDGVYVDFREYDPAKPVEKICFFDDGIGYDYIHTVLRHSNKADRETQTGKFGEGLKMISAAALRHDINIEFGSLDWTARPTSKKFFLKQEKKEVDLLCQEITTGYRQWKGSYTCIHAPSTEIIKTVCSFTERIIDFREDLCGQELQDLTSTHTVFMPKERFAGELFVKKIKYYLEKPLYFTYQITGADADLLLSPDRDHVLENNLRHIIKKIILNLNNTDLIAQLIDVHTPDCVEKSVYAYKTDSPVHPEQWRKAFYSIYGHKAVLAENFHPHINEDAKNKGFKVVKGISSGLHEILHNAGIPTVSQVSSRNLRYEAITPERLSVRQRGIYELYKAVDLKLFGASLNSEVHIFSHAFDEHGEATWFRGMSHFDLDEKEKSKIYIRLDQLKDPKTFLTAYAHEAVHIYTKSVDMTKEFEEGLTKALGEVLKASLFKPNT